MQNIQRLDRLFAAETGVSFSTRFRVYGMQKPAMILILIVALLVFPFRELVFADRFVDAVEAYGQGDYSVAMQQFNALAEKGDVRAQYWLGYMHQKGEGVKKNPSEAAKWYRKAAELGYARAQCKLGGMYVKGEGLKRDLAEAARWYQKAAEQGNTNAQDNLGGMYARGKGVPQDFVKSYMWLDLAAKRYLENTNRDEAAKKRDSIASRMTPAQIAEAQRLSREWKPKKAI